MTLACFKSNSSFAVLQCDRDGTPRHEPQAVYLNKILHGYLKYGRPIWLTEFACADDAALETVAGQRSYLSEALLLLELHPDVERYAW